MLSSFVQQSVLGRGFKAIQRRKATLWPGYRHGNGECDFGGGAEVGSRGTVTQFCDTKKDPLSVDLMRNFKLQEGTVLKRQTVTRYYKTTI